jgi:hypothetical protein
MVSRSTSLGVQPGQHLLSTRLVLSGLCFHLLRRLNPLAHMIYSAVLDATLNYNAHAKFANKEVDKLEAEEKKDVAPATQDESAAGEAAPAPDATAATEADPAATAA